MVAPESRFRYFGRTEQVESKISYIEGLRNGAE